MKTPHAFRKFVPTSSALLLAVLSQVDRAQGFDKVNTTRH